MDTITKPSFPININENAHTKIMRDMIKYLDECKNNKKNCQCSCVLEFNPNESDEFKKWKFLYQCNDDNKTNTIVKKITTGILNGSDDINIETYNVQKGINTPQITIW
jgi:hypothetical protein